MEGDLDTVVKAFGNLDKGPSSYGLLINDEGLFSELFYSHTMRDGNRVVHSLARLSMTMSECTM